MGSEKCSTAQPCNRQCMLQIHIRTQLIYRVLKLQTFHLSAGDCLTMTSDLAPKPMCP